MIIEIFNYSLTAILIGICGAWIFLIRSMINSLRLTPWIDEFEKIDHNNPKVSIILPARNEEEFLGKCLDTLIDQDYPNYEIIVIDDSSEDSTGNIISEYAKQNSKIISVSARPKPDGWMGKELGMHGRIQKSNWRIVVIYRCRYHTCKKCNLTGSITSTYF